MVGIAGIPLINYRRVYGNFCKTETYLIYSRNTKIIMNNKAKKRVKDFYLSVVWYLKKEYKPKYYRYCQSHMDSMCEKVSPLYWGGSNISNTAAELVAYIKKVSA